MGRDGPGYEIRYIQEFRNGQIAKHIAQEISRKIGDKNVTLMEVCGTHTMAIHRYGIKNLLPQSIRLLSGPGCPVCVTPNEYIDKVIAYSHLPDTIVATFGDMIRVPGSSSSLEGEMAEGRDIRVVYSPLDALKIAQDNPKKRVIFLGVGFETTAPTVAASILEAEKRKLENFFVASAHKLIPPAMRALVAGGKVKIDGFLCPGHVSTIIGSQPYQFLAEEYGKACVIAGFEPLDILQGILMLVKQIMEGNPRVEIQYRRVVRQEGNPIAIGLMDKVFERFDSSWRGLGLIPDSGLKIKEKYKHLDVESTIRISVPPPAERPGCICGLILQGVKEPPECRLFGKVCTPETPVGPCMVSSEGTCAAYYKYSSPELNRSNGTKLFASGD